MSLAIALKESTEHLGRLMLQAREVGLAVTAAEEKHDEVKAKELNEKFSKTFVDLESVKTRVERLKATLDAEKLHKDMMAELTTISNPIVGDPSDASRLPGQKPTPAELMAQARVLHREAFGAYVRSPDSLTAMRLAAEKLAAIGPTEKHALLGTQNQLGGFLIPEDFRAEIVKNLAGYAVMRTAGVKVVPTSLSTLVYPSIVGGTDPYSTGVSGAWRAEGSQGTDGTAPALQTQPRFGQERIPVHVWQPAAIVLTRELMDDSAAPLEAILAELLGETKALDEDSAFIAGTGAGQPKGLLQYVVEGLISTVNSGSSGAMTYNGLIDLMMNLKAQYRQNAKFLMRSTVFGEILKLKDSSQMPIMYGSSLPGTLFGKNVMISEFMPVSAADAKPVLFGDFRFYCIAERQDMRIQRLEERFAPNVAFMPTARLGGGLLRTDAFVAQKQHS